MWRIRGLNLRWKKRGSLVATGRFRCCFSYFQGHVFFFPPVGSGIKTLSQLHISNLRGQRILHFYLGVGGVIGEWGPLWILMKNEWNLMFQSEFYMDLSFVVCVCYLPVSETHSQVILVIYVCVYIHLPPLSSSTCCSVSVSACVGLMERPSQPSPHWDIMVRQTYSTTQIKINKQSEVFALNAAPFF